MRRLGSIFLVILSLLCTVPALAEASDHDTSDVLIPSSDGLNMLQYAYTNSITASLGINGGVASCSGRVSASSSSNKVSVLVTLYRSSGSSWVSIATWTGNGVGLEGANAGGTKTITAGYNYKVIVTGTVKDLNGKVLETTTRESAIKAY